MGEIIIKMAFVCGKILKPPKCGAVRRLVLVTEVASN
jgi:hypothetical protein